MNISMMVRHFLGLLLLSVGTWGFTSPPYDGSPFQMIGIIQGMTQKDPATTLAGGTLILNGIPITVPDNLLVTLPSITVGWNELFKGKDIPDLPGFNDPGISWEANVMGNRIGDTYTAGLVYIVQQSLQSLNGFINNIDLTTGHFTVAGTFPSPGTGGIDCVLNDPTGRYGRAYKDYLLFTVDPDNPSIHASTGYPLCIPRSTAEDPLCPSKNRPLVGGNPVTKIQFKDPATLTPTDPDPNFMVPLAVGDYVTFSGTMVKDVATGKALVAVYALNANLGLYTAPGKKPAYVSCEGVNYAVVTNQGGENAETRSVTFTTDPSSTIQWFAQDVEPCTGVIKERNLLLMQPNNAAPIGRAVFRLGKTDVSPATRYVGFRSAAGEVVTGNGLNAGVFIQPVFNYIFPELTDFGAPMFQLAFDAIDYLAKGGGPYIPGKPFATAPTPAVRVSQLNPWPGTTTPVAPTCPDPIVLPIPGSAPSTAGTTGGGTTSPPPPPPPDTVSIISATKRNQRGSTLVSVTAASNNFNAKLKLAIGGTNPVAPQDMTSQGQGRWFLSVAVKGKPNSVTVTSDKGGSATSPV